MRRSSLHIGHVAAGACSSNHLFIHSVWNLCPQSNIIHSFNSSIHIGQSSSWTSNASIWITFPDCSWRSCSSKQRNKKLRNNCRIKKKTVDIVKQTRTKMIAVKVLLTYGTNIIPSVLNMVIKIMTHTKLAFSTVSNHIYNNRATINTILSVPTSARLWSYIIRLHTLACACMCFQRFRIQKCFKNKKKGIKATQNI